MRYPKSSCYLIVYGEKLVFNRCLTNSSRENDDKVELKTEIKEKISNEGVLNKWLSEKGEKCDINMDMDYEKSILDEFSKEYKRRDGEEIKIDSLSTKHSFFIWSVGGALIECLEMSNDCYCRDARPCISTCFMALP